MKVIKVPKTMERQLAMMVCNKV